MAEFTEVMEQARRMCNAHGACSRCPLYGVSPSSISCAFDYLPGANFDEVERKIRAWAEKHPEPDHDGCDKCKYEDKSCNDEPCKRCRGNIGEPAPDLWEEG